MSRAIRQHLQSNIVGYIALFCFAMGGTAYATHPGGEKTISTGDIIDGEVQNPDLGVNAVSGANIIDGQVQNADLGPNSVTGDKVFPSTLTGSDVASSSLTGTDIAADSLTGSDIGTGAVGTAEHASSIPAARVTRTVSQAIPSGSVTTLNFNSERYDTASMHSTSSNISRLIAPVTGIYEVSASLSWGPSASGGARAVSLRRGTGGDLAWEYDPSNTQRQTISTMARLEAGDFVEVRVFQSSGSSDNIDKTQEYSPEFSMTWLAPGP